MTFLTWNTQTIDGVSYYAELPSRTYTGEEIEFTAVDMIDWDYRSILSSLDISYKDNTNAGTGYMTFSADGSNVIGSMTFPFTIDPADISTDVTISSIEDQVYKGEALTPAITATYNGMTLVEGTDYTVEYSNNNAVGMGKATITGIGNYTGTVTKTFTINEYDPGNEIVPIDIEDVSITLNADSYTYTGSEIVPSLKVDYTINETAEYYYTLVEGEDYTITCTNNIDVGTATYTITGIEQGDGGFTGTTKAATFTITAAQISSATMYGSISDQYYTGEEITPNDEVALKFNGAILVEDEDYVLIPSDNIYAGTATMTIRGIGNFTGTDTTTFTILSTELTESNVTVSDIEDVTYNKSAQEPEPDVYLDGVLLTKDVDYTLSYENNTNAGTATVIITGKDNCTGEIRKDFTIKPKSGNMFIIILLDDWQ
ncbi:MAG: hypothetical protein LUF26_08765 [Firmicutes bacterium]|nr:hypothetical protein [Bacillota bacterium]